MKAYRTEKLDSKEFSRVREIGANYHKFMWTKFKIRIKTKRLNS